MGLLKDRLRFSNKGLGSLEIREISPTSDAAYQNLGFLSETALSDVSEMEDIADETGSMQNTIERTRAARMKTNLMQVSIDEMSYINNSANKYHSIRYSGMMNEGVFQFFAFEQGRIIRNLARPFTNQKQTIPFEFLALKQEPTTFTTPEYHMAESKGRIRTENLQMWLNPRWLGAPERGTAKVFDISGFARHGDLNSDFASIWQTGTPESILRFDGVNDQCSFGDVCNIGQTHDVMVEAWVKVLGADGAQMQIIGKKVAGSDAAGWTLYRTTGNKMSLKLSDGSTSAFVASASNVLQNVWKHVVVAIDRDGNGRIFLNGVLDATVAVSSIGNSTTTNVLLLGKDAVAGSTYGNVEIGGVRFYNFGAGGLPSDIATIILNHYNAEKSYYGL